MHSSGTPLQQVPLQKVIKAWARWIVEVALYIIVAVYAFMFLTHTLTRFAQTYSEVFTKQKHETSIWKDYCEKALERHNEPKCEDARHYLLVNPYGRIVNLVVHDMPFLGVCGKSETCFHFVVELIHLLLSWSFVIRVSLLTLAAILITQYLGPHLFGAARLTKTYKATQRGIVNVPMPVS